METKYVLNKDLQLKEYMRKFEINPADILYASYDADQVSLNQISFSLNTPNELALLSALAYIEVDMTLSKTRIDTGAAVAFVSRDKVSIKPSLVLARSCRQISHVVNSDTLVYDDPQQWEEIHSIMNMSKEAPSLENKFYDLQGLQNQATNILEVNQKDWKTDLGQEANSNYLDDEMYEQNGALFKAGTLANLDIKHMEPVFGGLFNPYYNSEGHREGSIYNQKQCVMSGVKTLRLSYVFGSNFGDQIVWPVVLGGVESGDPTYQLNVTSINSAKLKLRWFQPKKVHPERPRLAPFMQLRQWITNIGTVNQGSSTSSITSRLIQTTTTSSMICVYGKRDITAADYIIQPYQSYSSGAGNLANVQAVNNFDEYLRIESIKVIVGPKSQVINQSITPKQLYYLTSLNCNKNFPYTKQELYGGKGIGTVTDQQFRSGKCFACFTPAQLAEILDVGVEKLSSIQFQVIFKSCVGHSQVTDGVALNYSYKLHVNVYNNDFVWKVGADGVGTQARFTEDVISVQQANKLISEGLHKKEVEERKHQDEDQHQLDDYGKDAKGGSMYKKSAHGESSKPVEPLEQTVLKPKMKQVVAKKNILHEGDVLHRADPLVKKKSYKRRF